MFQKIFEQLGNDYNEISNTLRDGRLADAFELCKAKEGAEAEIVKVMILILLKQYTKGIGVLEKVEADKAKLISADIYYELLALCYYETKNHLEAAKYYMKALEINKDNFYAKYNLANIYLLKKDYKKAYEYLIELERAEPENLDIKKNIKLLEKYL